MADKPSSTGGKIGEALFRGVMHLLYGKRAGETKTEKLIRLGIIIISLVALLALFSVFKKLY